MCELMNMTASCKTARWQLMSTVSALSLLGAVICSQAVAAADAERPTVWIELGAQIEHIDGGQAPFLPPFLTAQPRPDFERASPLEQERAPRYGIDMDGTISFEPKGSDWSFSAAIRYGRSNGNRHQHQQTTGTAVQLTTKGAHPPKTLPEKFDDIHVKHGEEHMVLDFMAGKDVGVGMFGRHGSSLLNLGVRFAQFNTNSQITASSNPDQRIYRFAPGSKYHTIDPHHSYAGKQHSERNFRGVGPSISWSASEPVIGDPQGDDVTLDWGANAAVLFGRQKASTSHQTMGTYHGYANHGHGIVAVPVNVLLYDRSVTNEPRSRSVVVPNVGGFVGLSFRYSEAKIKFGYRADYFFGAMDGGIDTHKSYDRTFYGPFATISIGLGG